LAAGILTGIPPGQPGRWAGVQSRRFAERFRNGSVSPHSHDATGGGRLRSNLERGWRL